MPWTTLIEWDAYDVLTAADLNSNFGNVSYLNSSLPAFCEGRLTLTSGVPITTSDVTGATTLYFTPIETNFSKVSLYDGSIWAINSLSEVSLSLSGLIKHVVYDIFLYRSGGTLTLEAVAWKKVTASNNPAAGSSVTINLSDTGPLGIGQEVTVKDGTNSEVARVTAVVASTSIRVASLANSYTTPDVYGYRARATALVSQNGVYVKNGATARRYVGTICITTSTGQCEDSGARRFVWNFYNQVIRPLYAIDTTDSWTYTTAAWRPANNNVTPGVGRADFVVGLARVVNLFCGSWAYNPSAVNVSCGIGLDAIGWDTALINIPGNATGQSSLFSRLVQAVSIGAHYAQRLEYSGWSAGTTTWYGEQSYFPVKSGLDGFLMG